MHISTKHTAIHADSASQAPHADLLVHLVQNSILSLAEMRQHGEALGDIKSWDSTRTQRYLEHRQHLAQVALVPAYVLGPGSTKDAEVASVWTNGLDSCTSATCVAVLDVTALGEEVV